jgi:hypothetical protein
MSMLYPKRTVLWTKYLTYEEFSLLGHNIQNQNADKIQDGQTFNNV